MMPINYSGLSPDPIELKYNRCFNLINSLTFGIFLFKNYFVLLYIK